MSFDIVIIKSNVKEVSSVAVVNDGKILMGKRNDNGRWTLPGGGLDKDEDSTDGAVRELHEEAGIKVNPKELKHLRTKKIKTHTGKTMTIHAYQYEWDGEKPTSKNDPDKEVKKWEWIDYSDEELPEEVVSNLHSPKNVVLQAMGLIKGEIMKSNFSFFIDLVKGATHKYLRKFRKGDKWVYIYYEPNQRPRHLEDEALKIIKKMAELGHEGAKKMLEQTTDVSDKIEEIKERLKRLAPQDRDSARARADRDELTREYGIDKEGDELERQLIPAKVKKQQDLVDKRMDEPTKTKLLTSVNESVDMMFKRFREHTGSNFQTSLERAGVTEESIKEGVMESGSLKEAMSKLHNNLKKVDEAHATAGSSSYSWASQQGGYANAIYNETISKLQGSGVLPEGYKEVHKRSGGGELVMPTATELQRQAEEKRVREEAERVRMAEEERRAMAELEGSMAFHIVSNMEGSMSIADKKSKAVKLDKAIRNIFGKQLKKEDWPYNFEGKTTKIVGISELSENNFKLEMQIYDADGRPMMEEWKRLFTVKGGRPHIYNSYMEVSSNARGGVQIGNLINQNQRKLMKSLPQGGSIAVTANIDVGGYTWANQGFSFQSSGDLQTYRRNFKDFLKDYSIMLTDGDMEKFKEPAHFAAFTDGKKYVYNTTNSSIPLTEQQKATGSLAGVSGEHPLNPEEIRSGKTGRICGNLGKKFMLRKHWSGIWDSATETDASKFGDAYYQLRDRAVEVFADEYKNVLGFVEGGERGRRATPSTPPITPEQRNSTVESSSPSTAQSERMTRIWARPGRNGGRATVRMSPERVQRVARWSDSDFEHFLRNAPITRDARANLRRAREARNSSIPF